jgi:hypothetical protein
MHQMFGENLPEPIKVWLDSLNEEINGSVENLGEGLYNNEEFPWSEIYGNISQLKIVLRQIPK